MNQTILNQARFADAAGADLTNKTGDDIEKALAIRLSVPEAKSIVAIQNVFQWSDPVTSLSVTIFKDKATRKATLAISGSQQVTDFLVDGLIVLGVPPALNPQFIVLQQKIQEWSQSTIDETGATVEPLLPATFTTTGHSLGGYLAAAVKADYVRQPGVRRRRLHGA